MNVEQPPIKAWRLVPTEVYPRADCHHWRTSDQPLNLGTGSFLTVQRARKTYRCGRCAGRILPGDIYLRFKSVREHDGIPAGLTTLSHLRCESRYIVIEFMSE